MSVKIQMSSQPQFQRAVGEMSVRVAANANGVTQLRDLRQQGSMRAIFPRPSGRNFETVLLNTAGGITGGDRFKTKIVVGDGARLSLTTQAAERIYRAVNADVGQVHNQLTVADNAQLFWLPQETILFDASRMKRHLDVALASTARFLMLEPLVFGREASGEHLNTCFFSDRVNIQVDGMPVYLDGIQLDGDVAANLQHAAIGNTARALANIVLYDRNAAQSLDAVRALLPQSGGASLLDNNLMVIRILTQDSFELRKTLLPILTLLTYDAVPKNWRL